MKSILRDATTLPAQNAFASAWPTGFDRIPDEPWVTKPIDDLTLKYENAGANSFSKNWDPTVAQVLTCLDERKTLVDYSSGTGLFTQRLLQSVDYTTCILNLDISPRYLRIAADKFREEERVALRLLKRRDGGSQFQLIDEAVNGSLLNRGIDILTSTNAIHLYPNLSEILDSWHRVLRPGGMLLINSGDIDDVTRPVKGWRLHDTISRVNEIAEDVVRSEPIFEQYCQKLDNSELMSSYAHLRQNVYPPSKPVDEYLESLTGAGFKPLHYFDQYIDISVDEMSDALLPYHDVILGWVGGSQKVEGQQPTDAALRDRLFLMKYAVQKVFGKRDYLQCPWTYVTCKR